MNLLCPNCSKMLTVPEQYAGQLMKCPLCSGTFTVPALPSGANDPAPQPAFSSQPAADPYQLQPSPPTPGKAEPAFNLPAAPVPAFSTAPPTPPPPAPPPTTFTGTGPGQPPSKPVLPGDYTGGVAVRANAQILQWVTPAALVLIFVLQFFPWIGVYVGSVPVDTWSAWGAAFGAEPDPRASVKPESKSESKADAKGDLRVFFEFQTNDSLKKLNDGKTADEKIQDNRPGVSLLLLFYIVFFLLGLVLTAVVVALPFVKVPLPPPVQQFLPWKWAIVAGINAVLLLFLGLQLLLSFGLESSVTAYVDSQRVMKAKEGEGDAEKTFRKATRSQLIGMVQRTIWVKIAFVLHLIAAAAAGLVFWMEKRGPGAPPPALELRW